ncbi:hypothetical protein BTM25_15680 [Actinomadura rubteroloni]|uniref:DUF397 domain-containing protein n=1 Tax=Actinomadura rubteroloni TaxID=1926885 RepID=A0A2P4UQ32_9ACTN|nr:DUF397 domain-containing protein [Actinomadura rubteroloni]POM27157.1 hypothetical protein BTM25_15680 [Actinomadura rubteroloni]
MIQWRKSSRSEGSVNGACVELAGLSGVVGVRDSKNPDAGHLTLPRETFAALVAHAKDARP